MRPLLPLGEDVRVWNCCRAGNVAAAVALSRSRCSPTSAAQLPGLCLACPSMNSKALAALGCSLLLLILAECQEKEKPPKATEKKITKEPKPNKLKPPKATGQKLQQAAAKPRKAKARVKPTAPPSQVHQPASILTRVVARGRFQKVPDSLTLRAGDTLELRCRGQAVRWRFPAYLEDEDEGRLRIKHFERHSQLLVVNSMAADTGEYSCWSFQCRDSECQDGEDRTGKAFIFFTDPQELFVPTEDYYEVVQLRTNHPTLLPCQVTSPLAKVTLHREFPPEEVAVDGIDISYDMKRGFVIHRPRPSYAGSLFCMASLDGMRQISTKYMLIYINSSAPKPMVSTSATTVRTGENFNVTCTVFGEPEVAVDFTWEYPGQQIGRPPYIRERTDLARRGGQVQQESESILYVDEARAIDEGLYTCSATNLQGTTTVSTRVRVLPATLSPKGAQSG
ncbi:Platelet-derived growth factor receptor-like protein [Chelonia mydas]|uniref:Platelet-derived growth factor receptor-like protein n=1 Tax=Chelonia mydas TaxID=8469 RepID=M7AY59_CHEMY|nr:Platelet-derived growth factor receptor-like protein [Chelonia mydas]